MDMTPLEKAATAEPVLPCPFCGAAPKITEDDSYGQCWVSCVCEHEPGIPRPVGKLADAIAAWNRRSPIARAAEEAKR